MENDAVWSILIKFRYGNLMELLVNNLGPPIILLCSVETCKVSGNNAPLN